jgi:hypothetical protein
MYIVVMFTCSTCFLSTCIVHHVVECMYYVQVACGNCCCLCRNFRYEFRGMFRQSSHGTKWSDFEGIYPCDQNLERVNRLPRFELWSVKRMGIAKTPTWQAILESHDRRPREPHPLFFASTRTAGASRLLPATCASWSGNQFHTAKQLTTTPSPVT